MINLELTFWLAHLPGFVGVFARDTVPNRFQSYPTSFVSNTQNRDHIGEHWVAVYKPKPRVTYFFCSFGKEPAFYGFQFTGDVYYWPHRVQGNTNTCGRHVIYFLERMSRGLPLQYTNNLVFNEQLINT